MYWGQGFSLNDLLDVYEYCSSPYVGPNAGWAPHKNIEEMLGVLDKTEQEELFYLVKKILKGGKY